MILCYHIWCHEKLGRKEKKYGIFFRAEIRSSTHCLEGNLGGSIEAKEIKNCDQFNKTIDELKLEIIKKTEEEYPDVVLTEDEISILAFNRL